MKQVIIIALPALALAIIFQLSSGEWHWASTHQSATVIKIRHQPVQPENSRLLSRASQNAVTHAKNSSGADHAVDTFLTPSRATLAFESNAEQVIQTRYEQVINKNPQFIQMDQSGIVAKVQVVITKNYGGLPGDSESDYLGQVDITFENPRFNRSKSIILKCSVDKVVPGPFSFNGDATTGYLWGCDREGPLGVVTLWRESGHIDE